MKKYIFVLFLLFAGLQAMMAQDVSQYKALDDSAYQTVPEYQSGNKYQKDAILFMDMVADTHPYYIKADRRAEWFSKKNALLEQCGTIQNDAATVDDTCMEPDCVINLDDKEQAWQYIIKNYGN